MHPHKTPSKGPYQPVLFYDNHLLITEKPAGIVTQPNWTDQSKKWIASQYNKKGNVFLHPIHRLDKPVEGLVLFAKSSKALSRLQNQMRSRQIGKFYFALIHGHLPSKEGVLHHHVLHLSFRARIAKKQEPEAKEAILEYSTLVTDHQYSLVRIALKTGRYHQIRLQLSATGCPVVGDALYGSPENLLHGIALHHGELCFNHPISGEARVFQSHKAKAFTSCNSIKEAKTLFLHN